MFKSKPVVAGFDGSTAALVALKWAGDVAQRRGVPLLIVSATGGENSGLGLRRERVLRARLEQAQRAVEEAVKYLDGRLTVSLETEVVAGEAAEVLSERSKGAGLVVVGHRGVGGVRSIFVGSVAFAVMNHAQCPVAVVRETMGELPSEEHPIVVGIDGSSGSYRAMEYAADLALDTHATLCLAVAWQGLAPELSDTIYETDGQGRALPGERDPWQQSSRKSLLDELSEEVTNAAADTALKAVQHLQKTHPSLKGVCTHVEEGAAVEVVIKAAEGAALIVVGARGHSGFMNLLLGSTSRKIVQNAPCAVMVVR